MCPFTNFSFHFPSILRWMWIMNCEWFTFDCCLAFDMTQIIFKYMAVVSLLGINTDNVPFLLRFIRSLEGSYPFILTCFLQTKNYARSPRFEVGFGATQIKLLAGCLQLLMILIHSMSIVLFWAEILLSKERGHYCFVFIIK